jgi:RimJ/RimL family protein N-acetyltransferase
MASRSTIKIDTFTQADFSRLISWVKSAEELMAFAGPNFKFPLNVAQLEAYLADNKSHPFKVIDKATNTVIGHAEVALAEDGNAKLCRILIGDEQFRGKGLGQEITQQLLEYAFREFDLERIELNVFDWNLPAIKCYEKVGFVVNPSITRQREVNGKKWNAINMQIQKADWERNTKE